MASYLPFGSSFLFSTHVYYEVPRAALLSPDLPLNREPEPEPEPKTTLASGFRVLGSHIA